MSIQYHFTTDVPSSQPQPVMSSDQTLMLRYFLNRSISLPQAENPVVSIIIPVFNQFEYTIACLQSLEHACAGNVPYEVILADDGSTDRTREIGKQVANLRIIHNDSNQHGFLPNVNFAAQFARGEYLFLLNNDTLLQEDGGMLERLVAHFADPTVGVVGNLLTHVKSESQHCIWLFLSEGSAWELNITNKSVIEGDAIEGSAFMLPSKLWRELGGFDTAYGRGYFEETDLCFRIKVQKRQRILCDMQSKIIHFGERTFQESGVKSIGFKKNFDFFFQRWHDYLAEREQGLPEGDRVAKIHALYAKLYLDKA